MTQSYEMKVHPGPDWPQHVDGNSSTDRFVGDYTTAFAGTHLLIDCWNAENLDNIAHIEATLRRAVTISGATLLHIHLHHFTPNDGVSGVAVLAESHITIHTWPERGYAALDVFMCGDTQPQLTIPVFAEAFGTENIQTSSHQRGRSGPSASQTTDRACVP